MPKKRYVSRKYLDETFIFPTKVLRIEEQNLLVNDKYKTVFYCKSINNPDGIMCIAWGRTTIKEGDRVELKGRPKDKIFLVWSIQKQAATERVTASQEIHNA